MLADELQITSYELRITEGRITYFRPNGLSVSRIIGLSNPTIKYNARNQANLF